MPELMAYFFQSQMYWQQITENLSGSAQPNCNATKLSSLALPIPPLNEQSRIVAKLEKLLGRVDAAQARLATIPRILKRFRQSVLAAACSGRLTADWRTQNPNGEPTSALLERIRKQRRTSLRFGDAEADSNTNDLPESWLVVKIEELTSIQNGRAFPSKQYAQDGVRLLRPGNLTVNGQVEWNDKNTACLPKQWIKDYPEFLLGTGELLMNLTAQSLKDEFLGRVCIKSDSVPALLNQRIARFVNQGSDDLRPYLFIYFKSPQFRSYVNTLDTGSLIRHMHSKQVLSHVAPLPPLAEQQEIVRRVEALFKTVDALEARYRKAQAHVDKLTQSLLAKAFRGELVPQDLSDEPASVLLERIRMERNGTEPKKRGRRK
jgi:type I restriction enzyme S subunit